MKATRTMISVVTLVLAVASMASATTIYSEDFSAMTAGALDGQGGWTLADQGPGTGVVNVGTGGAIDPTGMQVLPVTGHGDTIVLTRDVGGLDPTKVTTLQFDAAAGFNGQFGFEMGPRFHPSGDSPNTMVFEYRNFIGVIYPAGYDESPFPTGSTASFKIVLDGPSGAVSGYYDYDGTGFNLVSTFGATGLQIAGLSQLMLIEDTVGSNTGIGIDNISLTATPEPSTLVLLGCGLVSLLAYAWRKRR